MSVQPIPDGFDTLSAYLVTEDVKRAARPRAR